VSDSYYVEASYAKKDDNLLRTRWGETISLSEALRRRRISQLIKQFGHWAVTDWGVELLSDYYPIEKTRVHLSNWEEHIGEKNWCDDEMLADFCAAIEFARDLWPRTGKRHA